MAAGKIKTYNPREVTISLGNHIAEGFAEDSFITIEPNGDGITKVVGCDGEIVRSVSPDRTYNVRLALLMSSATCKFLQDKFDEDITTGNALFPILVKDLKGGMVFQSDSCWVVRSAPRNFGRTAPDREWELSTGEADLTEEG